MFVLEKAQVRQWLYNTLELLINQSLYPTWILRRARSRLSQKEISWSAVPELGSRSSLVTFWISRIHLFTCNQLTHQAVLRIQSILHRILDSDPEFLLEVYQVCWGRISSCEKGKESWLWGRIESGKKGKGKPISSSLSSIKAVGKNIKWGIGEVTEILGKKNGGGEEYQIEENFIHLWYFHQISYIFHPYVWPTWVCSELRNCESSTLSPKSATLAFDP